MLKALRSNQLIPKHPCPNNRGKDDRGGDNSTAVYGHVPPLDFARNQIIRHERFLVVGITSRPGRRALRAEVTPGLRLNHPFKSG